MKKDSIKKVSLFLIIALLLSSISSIGVNAGIAKENTELLSKQNLHDVVEYENAVEKEHVKRLYDEEQDLNTLIYQNADGTNTMYLYSYPVKYINESGAVRDKSLKIEETDESFMSAQNDIVTTFGKTITDGIRLSYDDEGINVLLIPQVNSSLKASEGILSDDQKSLTYLLDKNVSLDYSLTFNGFKEDIVLQKYTGTNQFVFTLLTNGLALKENESGSLILTNEDGDSLVNIGDIIIFSADEKNNTYGSISFDVVEENEEYLLYITVDEEYLTNENTAYPIRIDPTIEINYDNNGSGAIEDVTLNSLAGSDGSSGSISIGKRNTYGVSRILMKFPALNLSVIPVASDILSATVYIRDLMCEGEEMSVYCYPFTGNTWSESTANWSNVNPDSFGSLASSRTVSYSNGVTLSPAHRYGFNILSIVRGWKTGTYSQSKGIMFKASSTVENGSELYKTFSSYNRSSIYRPSLTVTYASIAGTVTVSSVPYSSYRYLSASYKYPFKFTPSVTTRYSVWTTGSIDTKVYVYDNAAMTNQIAYNDDSGHSLNPCLTVSLTAGHSYYFVIQGYSATTSGYYTFRLNRGLPMSGYEQSKNFTTFNSSTYQYYTNCYTYALNMWLNPLTNQRFRPNGQNPGEMAGSPITLSDLVNASTAKAAITEAVKDDCVYWGGSRNDFYETTETAMVPEGYYKVALVLYPGHDYHWYRHVSDLSGRWAHKMSIDPASEYDNGGSLIYFPQSANRGNYTEFLGYFAIKVPSSSSDGLQSSALSTSSETLTEAQETYDFKNDLTISQFEGFTNGISNRDEVKSVVGEHHDVYGSGYIADVYYIKDGTKVAVYYACDIVDQIRIINADDSYEIIVG
ncbi:MAG: hypothetical protein A2Y17_10205 [Clostridiales bacterium GWF2_38_85]|nr:MAG: hypothetical protein A2Y17_10205 [Clostridiales bacterium GWF2_38_85]HBL83301.1 hypothetical protein [Clostridiales bacterium]